MKRYFFVMFLLVSILFSGCGTTSIPTVINAPFHPTTTPNPSNTPTPLPTSTITPSPMPTATNTLVPTPTNTPSPTPLPKVPITVYNVSDLFSNFDRTTQGGDDAAWSPDGKWLAIANPLGVILFDGATYQKITTITMKNGAQSLMFSQDNRQLLAISANGDGLLWDIANNQITQSFTNLSQVKDFCPQGQTLAIYGWTAKRLICGNQKAHKIFRTNLGPSQTLSQDGNLAVVGGHDDVRIFDVLTGKVSHSLIAKPIQLDEVFSVALSSDGGLLAYGGDLGVVRLWHVQDEKLLTTFTVTPGKITGLAFRPDGNMLVAASDSDTTIVDLANNYQQMALEKEKSGVINTGEVSYFTLNPDGSLLATSNQSYNDAGNFPKTYKVWNTFTNQTIFETQEPPVDYFDLFPPTPDIAWSPNGQILATGGPIHVILWNTITWKEIRTLEIGETESLTFSPDSRFLAVGCYSMKEGSINNDHCIKVYDVETGQKILDLGGSSFITISNYAWKETHQLSFSPDGKILASTSGYAQDGIKFWSMDTGKEIDQEFKPVGSIYFRFSPSWDLVATNAMNSIATELWKINDGKIVRTNPILIDNNVGEFAINPGGSLFLDANRKWGWYDGDYNDKKPRILEFWDIQAKKLISKVDYGSTIKNISFSADGCTLAISSEDGITRIFRVQ
ncbi:MAG: hypothetical protein P4L50_28315, partial [Anaerolineaceae bacterium]|nr:hypothetical protein [Anaerolineaceae bacterium]